MSWRSVVVLGVAGMLLLTGCEEQTPRPTPSVGESAAPTPIDALPEGEQGAAHFDDLALVVGEGPVDVQVWVDPFCPDCRAFEETAGADIAALVDGDAITYSIHLMNFLDRASEGSAYSTRAGSALVCVAVEQPGRLLAALQALFAAQPQEGTTGLSDQTIIETLADAGVDGLDGCIEEAPYAPWVQASNDSALAGIDGADIAKITGTPTLVVEGVAYTGDISDPRAIREFIGRGGKQ